MRVSIVGVGLIGGSLALALKEKGIAKNIIGVEADPLQQQKALDLGGPNPPIHPKFSRLYSTLFLSYSHFCYAFHSVSLSNFLL